MILDDNGLPLEKPKSKEEILEMLKDVAPKNREEESILATHIAEAIEFWRKNRMGSKLKDGFDGLFEQNHKKRDSNGWTDGKTYRHIASIPRDMAYVAEKVFGKEVWTDKALFKKAFKEDETGRLCLTVDPDTI